MTWASQLVPLKAHIGMSSLSCRAWRFTMSSNVPRGAWHQSAKCLVRICSNAPFLVQLVPRVRALVGMPSSLATQVFFFYPLCWQRVG
jgi:hypothetical protein